MSNHPRERGQALILIAFAAIGLFAFTALAIDGGAVFSKKRQSQNAADAAALAGALALSRSADPTAGHAAAMAAADASTKENKFNNDTTTNEVFIYNPPVSGPYTGKNDYVQVQILSHVTTYFTRVIGRENVDTAVEAVAQATPPKWDISHLGDALVSLMPSCKTPGQSDDPFVVSGNSDIIIKNAGIRVNSDCAKNGHEAFTQNGGGTVNVDPNYKVCVYGAADYRPGKVVPAPSVNCPPTDESQYQLPNPFCSHTGKIVDQGKGNYTAIPGNFNGAFPGVSPAGTLRLQKGIYCLHDGIDLHSKWFLTTDSNPINGQFDSATEGVLFYVDGGDITFNGNTFVDIHAIDTTADDFPQEFVNLLFYIPPSNPANIKLTGDNTSQFTGTILAPTASTEILGNNGTLAFNSQIISYTVKVSGGGSLDINYSEDKNTKFWTNPAVHLVK